MPEYGGAESSRAQSMYLVVGRGYTVVGSVYYLYQRSLSLSLMVPERIGNSANVLKPGNKLIFKNCPSSKLCPSSLSCSPEKKIRDMGEKTCSAHQNLFLKLVKGRKKLDQPVVIDLLHLHYVK